MSNHFSADNLKFPGDDRRLDLTDVVAFTAPHDPDTTVLIIDSNPTSAPPPIPAPVTGPEFYPGAVYRINIDTDGAAHAAVAFTFTFEVSEDKDGSIALEVPRGMFGGPVSGVWASISRRRSDGTLEQLDRGGNPTINPVINPDGEKTLFNSRQPADDVANYLQPWTEILQNAGGYSPDQARAAALQVLPDILRYDRTVPAAYPNGRGLTDAVYNVRYACLTNGNIPPPAPHPPHPPLPPFPH